MMQNYVPESIEDSNLYEFLSETDESFSPGKIITSTKLLAYARKIHKSGWTKGSFGNSEDIRQYPDWILVDFPVVGKLIDSYHLSITNGYAKLNTPFPPIIVIFDNSRIGFNIIDGGHRYKSAWTRGDTIIPAYIPVFQEELFQKMIKNRK